MNDETRQGFFEALMEFGALSPEDKDRVISGLSRGSESSRQGVDYLHIESAESQLIKRTRSELEDVLNWRRERLVV
jgi:hypothetical protein